VSTVFLHVMPAGIIILHSLQMRVLLENTTFLLHKIVRIAGIIRVAGIIRGRALYEEIRYLKAKGWINLNFFRARTLLLF
jgi:methyl coenzyme M reductase subunit D